MEALFRAEGPSPGCSLLKPRPSVAVSGGGASGRTVGLDEALGVGPQKQIGALISRREPALPMLPTAWGHQEVERSAAWGRALTRQGVLQRLGVGHSGLQTGGINFYWP